MSCSKPCFHHGQAVEFVSMQHDDELWEELIKLCLHKAEMVSINALRLLTNFPYTDLF